MSVVVQREPPLAWVVIDRPAAHNALDSAAWRRLGMAAAALAVDAAVRVVIVRGAGDCAFIAGADLGEFRDRRADAASGAAYDRLAAGVWQALGEMPQPVIAMVNGVCYGGGVAVALACDLRVAADHARFAVPVAKLGLAYPMEGVEQLVHVVGRAHAADLLLSARVVDADEALRIGLIHRVVGGVDLERLTREWALAMAEGAPLTVAAHKRMIREALRAGPERDVAAVTEAVHRCFGSGDYQEGITAFLEKRLPRFSGR